MPNHALRIGVASCFFHADPTRPIFKGKTLLYLEESLAHWLMAGGAVPLLLPTPAAGIRAEDLLDGLDGLVLQGGSDVAPESYGGPRFGRSGPAIGCGTATRPTWCAPPWHSIVRCSASAAVSRC